MNRWFSYKFRDEDNNIIMVRGKDHLEEEMNSHHFKQRLEISCIYESGTADLFPDEATLTYLDQLEFNLERELNRGTKSILVLSFTGALRRVWHVYTEELRSAIFSINMAIEPEVDLKIVHEPDEDWTFYKSFYVEREDVLGF